MAIDDRQNSAWVKGRDPNTNPYIPPVTYSIDRMMFAQLGKRADDPHGLDAEASAVERHAILVEFIERTTGLPVTDLANDIACAAHGIGSMDKLLVVARLYGLGYV